MGTLETQLMADLKEAMRAGDTARRDVIRFLRASMKNAQIARVQFSEEAGETTVVGASEREQPLTDEEEFGVLKRQIKQRQDAIEQFERANRADLVGREQAQLTILQHYLPAGLSEAEIDALIQSVIAETGASGPGDMKLVMPVALARAAGQADNRALSAAARRLLAAR